MPVSFVKKALTSGGLGSPTSVTATFSAAASAGNLIVGTATYGATAAITVSVISTSAGANPTGIIDFDGESSGPVGSATFYYKNIPAGITAITFATPAAPGFTAIEMQEVSGCDTVSPLDVHGMALQASASTQSTPAVTTTAAGEYIYCTFANTVSGFTTATGVTGTGVTLTFENSDSFGYLADGQGVQVAAGSVHGTFSLTAPESYITGIATFKAASAGGTAVTGYFFDDTFYVAQQVQAIGW